MKRASHRYLKLRGWTFIGHKPDVAKYIIVAAPHTSNWDFVVMMASLHSFGIDARFMGKDSLGKGPLGKLMRRWGLVPVRRDRPEKVVERVAQVFADRDALALVMTPDGTRSRAERWKSGFYRIALAAQVPLVLANLHAPSKSVTLSAPLYLTGDVAADMARVRAFYSKYSGWRPGFEAPIVLREENQ